LRLSTLTLNAKQRETAYQWAHGAHAALLPRRAGDAHQPAHGGCQVTPPYCIDNRGNVERLGQFAEFPHPRLDLTVAQGTCRAPARIQNRSADCASVSQRQVDARDARGKLEWSLAITRD
jgi:hypothetical protein